MLLLKPLNFYSSTPISNSLQLGVAGVTALGIGTLHKIIKLVFTPKAAAPIIGGAWILGGAFIIFHFTGSTMAGWAMMTQRNARRKRVLQIKLEGIQRRFNSLASSLGIEADVGPPAGGGEEQQEGLPTRHSSPTHSTGSSAELVEAPTAEEEAEGNVGGAGGAAASTSASGKKAESRGYSSFDSLKRYASLGGSRKKDT
jgi:hypothetical protein